MAVAGPQFRQGVLVAEPDVEDCVVAGVVDDQRAVVLAQHLAGEHDVGHVHVDVLGVRQSAAEGKRTGMLDMRTRR